MDVSFINHKEWGIDPAIFNTSLAGIKAVMKPMDGLFNVVLVNDVYIRAFNKKYRGKDQSTDVLSFFYEEPTTSADLVGEIYISVETAERQAKDFKHSLADELNKLFVHGFLHLHGHDHEKEDDYKIMNGLETRILGRNMT